MNDELCINTLRCLALDMIDKANSGHPGMALDAAPILHTLFAYHLVSSAADSKWIKRDRFILSSGHVSSLLYSMLHLTGYDYSIDDLKAFRQFNSKTPGHPEYGHCDGVDISTGPLGQGIANAVGMAMAEAHLVFTYPTLAKYLEHYTYVLCGDGDLEEGVGLEALALAGANKLTKLIVIYDNNDVTLDGPLSQSSTDDMVIKAKSMGLNVIIVRDGNDVEAINEAITAAKSQNIAPTMIIVKTIIGYGSPRAGSNKVHGSPLGEELSLETKRFYKWHYLDEKFYVPEEVKEFYNNTYVARGLSAYMQYKKDIERLTDEEKEILNKINNVDVLNDVKEHIPTFVEGYNEATRNVSENVLNVFSTYSSSLFGGSADVEASVKTKVKGKGVFGPGSYDGQTINFGIREHAMCAIANGIAAHGGLMPYVGSFLVFSDYARGALRCAALMGLPVTYLFSHDSIAVGEDGPTHQPIEQVASLKLIPNFNVIRPADANETSGAYEIAFSSHHTPTAIILSRQKLMTVRGSSKNKVKKGGYVLSYEKNKIDAILIASGSEVNLAYNAQKELLKIGIDVRVVSMPSTYLFDKQKDEYKDSVLPTNISHKMAIDMGNGDLWFKYANYVISINRFGVSGNIDDVIKAFGFTTDMIVKNVREMIKN